MLLAAVALAAWIASAPAFRIDDSTTIATERHIDGRMHMDHHSINTDTAVGETLPAEWKDDYLAAAGRMVGTWADSENRIYQFRPDGTGLGFIDFSRARSASLKPSRSAIFFEGDFGGTLLRFRIKTRATGKRLRVEMLEHSQLGTKWAPLADFTKESWNTVESPRWGMPLTAAEEEMADSLIGKWSSNPVFSQIQRFFGFGDTFPFKTVEFKGDAYRALYLVFNDNLSVPLRPGGVFFQGNWDSQRSRMALTRVFNRFRMLGDGRIVGESRSMNSAWSVSFELVRIAMPDRSMPQVWEGGPKHIGKSRGSTSGPKSTGKSTAEKSLKSLQHTIDALHPVRPSSSSVNLKKGQEQRGAAFATLPRAALILVFAALGGAL